MTQLIKQETINFELAVKIADAAVLAKMNRHLKNIEITVIQGTLLGKKYDQIASECGYAPEYIKHDVGPKLWQILSSSLGEKVNKTNLMAVLSQQATEELPVREFSLVNTANTSSHISSELESPIGLLALDSNFYIERPPVESRCYEEIARTGALIRIKAPSQMGKTSLMVRILDHAKHQNCEQVHTVALSLQRAERSIFNDLDKFLRWFCAAITRKLQLPNRVEDYWSETFGSKSNCTAYFEDCLLSETNGVLVLALDQVDEVFLHPEIADDFFTLLRSWYEEAAYGDSGNPLWQNLRLVIVHSTEVYIPLDINKSPFNVGLPIQLQVFNPLQVFDLAQRYGINLSEGELSELMQLVDGHPYLVQQALYHLALQDLTFQELLETAATDAGIYSNHLHRHLGSLQAHEQLAEAYKLVIASSTPVELEHTLAFKLHSMGLVTLQKNQVKPSCNLYQKYFGNEFGLFR